MPHRKYCNFEYFALNRFRNGMWNQTEVAKIMGIPYSTIEKMLLERYIPYSLIASLYNATGDREIINFCVSDTFDLAVATRADVKCGRTVEQDHRTINAVIGDFNRIIDEALEDGEVDVTEAKKLLTSITAVEKKIQSLKNKIHEKSKQ